MARTASSRPLLLLLLVENYEGVLGCEHRTRVYVENLVCLWKNLASCALELVLVVLRSLLGSWSFRKTNNEHNSFGDSKCCCLKRAKSAINYETLLRLSCARTLF